MRLLALVLPLGLDTFAVSAALGVAGLSGRRRLRLGLLFALFEGGMPLAGLVIGATVGAAIGAVADFVAVAALAGVGAYMLLGDEEKEEARAERFATATGTALVVVGLSVSIDELAIGFALGLARVPVLPALALIALQAFLVSQIGLLMGHRVGEAFREGAERAAGVSLIAIAGLLLVAKLAGLSL